MAAVQNTQDVHSEFLWIDAEAPLVVILLITIVATVVIDEIIGSCGGVADIGG